MPVSVTMPRLGESVTEGTITRWLKQEGERVAADEPLLEVSTDKVDTEIPSPASGVLTKIVVRQDETVEVGAELAVIDPEGDDEGDDAGGGSSVATEQPAQQDQPAPDAQPDPQPEPQAADPQPEQQAAPPEQTAPPDQTEDPQPEPQAAPPEQPEQPAQPARAAEGTVVRLPALGESVTEGTVTRWLKQVGDQVEADEPLLEVSTDKVDTEIPAPASGTLVEIKVAQDETVPVGANLAVIGGSGGQPAGPKAEPLAEPAQPPRQAPAPAQREAPPAAPSVPASGASVPAGSPVTTAQAPRPAPAGDDGTGDGDVGGYVTPLVRKLAAEHGVELSTITGTGVGGRIRKQDVLEAAQRKRAAEQARQPAQPAQPATVDKPAAAAPPAAQPSPLRGRTEKLSRLRSIIAARMVESLQISAQLTTVLEVDVTKIARLRQEAKRDFEARHGAKLSFLPFFALATVEALRVHPQLNASIDIQAGTVTYHDAEHLAIAVDTERGLLAPVIHRAGDLNLAGMARRIADLAARTRAGQVSPDELSGGTFTLTNTGSRGVLFDTPIINQPQVAILGTGAVVKRAVVVDDPVLGELILPRSMVYLSLTYDHRIVDGADAARFLNTIKERLEGGHFEAELGLS